MERARALATDLYELTMAAGYFVSGVTGTATFELFVRTLPRHRQFLIAAGLEQVLEYLETLRFTAEDIDYLRQLQAFKAVPHEFFAHLREFRFRGEVWAIPEGTPVFANEPLLRVTAPIIEAQVVETFVLATMNFQTMVASKAARVVHAAAGRPVVEFGSRRAHGSAAGLYAARAAYVAGCAATSNVEAGARFGVPVSGTMAHSWVMSFADELSAFRSYLTVFPHNSTLLLDTYDTIAAARAIVAAGLRPSAVRLDSGNLATLSRAVRAILDAGGLSATRIFASGDLDEWRIAALMREGAAIDAFGVGTRLATSFDEPAVGGVYKLVESEIDHAVRERAKWSAGKATAGGRKQVWRRTADGAYIDDLVARIDELAPPAAEPLLVCVMRNGRRIAPAPPLSETRAFCRACVDRLPETLHALDGESAYPVRISERLQTRSTELPAGRVGSAQ